MRAERSSGDERLWRTREAEGLESGLIVNDHSRSPTPKREKEPYACKFRAAVTALGWATSLLDVEISELATGSLDHANLVGASVVSVRHVRVKFKQRITEVHRLCRGSQILYEVWGSRTVAFGAVAKYTLAEPSKIDVKPFLHIAVLLKAFWRLS